MNSLAPINQAVATYKRSRLRRTLFGVGSVIAFLAVTAFAFPIPTLPVILVLLFGSSLQLASFLAPLGRPRGS